jgi:hypothetical protein
LATVHVNKFDEIKDQVQADDGVRAYRMETLRNAAGYGKLGKYVVVEISDHLRRRGLGHAPDPLPSDSWATVLVYELGSDVEKLVNAINSPSTEGATFVRSFANQDAAQVLTQIRALVEASGVE